MQNNVVELGTANFDLRNCDIYRIIVKPSEPVSEFNHLAIFYISGNLTSAESGIINTSNNVDVIYFSITSVGMHILPVGFDAEDYINMLGIQTDVTCKFEGGLNVGWNDDNSWVEYNCKFQSVSIYKVINDSSNLINGVYYYR